MIKLLILDVDGVLTDGTKLYSEDGFGKMKSFCDKDFTAIKRIKAAGVKVCFLSGDQNVNKSIATNRNIDFYLARGKNKKEFLQKFCKIYDCSPDEMCFVGDDLFDIDLLKAVKYSFCPKNSLSDVKDCCMHVLLNKGGNNLIMELHDYLLSNNLIKKADLQSVMNLDALEKF
jgi:3-deoxy-D-manno-octulosonate 8-phosphate phosphatase (KDO 8-P phosphatase)